VREVSIYGLLLYGVPILVILVTLWVGYLGFKFYVDEVIKK
jgi:hypothetical protein